MDKQWFTSEMNKINVPQTEVQEAIIKGIARAQQGRSVNNKNKKRYTVPITAAIACICFFGSGFVFPQVSRVLADVPIIGKFYSSLHDSVGENLAASQLITELNQRAVSNGVGVTVNSVYYDGCRIGVTFKVDHMKMNSKDFYFDFKLADGSFKWVVGTQFSGIVTPEGDGIGHILLDYPEKELPHDMTLPLTLTSIQKTKGKWNFNIPISQLPNKKINVGKVVSSGDKDQVLNLETITVGKETVALDYKAVYSHIGKDDLMRIEKVTDDNGKEIPLLFSGMEFGRKEVGKTIESEERSLFEKIPDDAKFIMVYPYVRETEPTILHPLSGKTAFEVQSARYGIRLKVEKIELKNQQLVVQYTLDHMDTKHKSIEEIKNFGETLSLVDSAYIGKEIVPIGHIVKGNTVTVLNEKQLKFQSTFKLDGKYGLKNFSMENYSLGVHFPILFPEKHLPPLKVPLDR